MVGRGRKCLPRVDPIPGAPVSLAVDASDYAVGAVFTKSVTPAQRKYSAYDRELLAMYTAVKRCRHAIEGRNFVIFTEHKPLTYAFNQNLDKCSPRQFRHLDYIVQFTSDIRYIKEPDNNVADALPRIETIGKSVDHRTLAAAQENDTELREIINSGTSALQRKKVRFSDHDMDIFCDVTSEVARPYVRNNLCKKKREKM